MAQLFDFLNAITNKKNPNIMEEDPYKIWTSKECLDFRRIIHERRLPDSCQGCPCGELGIT